jgi:hypothetical protein
VIITTINNNKLFVKFDSLIKEGMICLTDDKNFKLDHKILVSDFEVLDLPAKADKIHIQIETGKNKISKTINLIQQ